MLINVTRIKRWINSIKDRNLLEGRVEQPVIDRKLKIGSDLLIVGGGVGDD